ncbi:MAG: hypothetical protein GWN31_14550, partial [Candidatus Thorarchaeota archaeon]|nr:hypothetical protein [Nitrosopumilaceae archaeon]NIV66653.1 hypothetical protein [Nitrosopumilaceae archaeon]NIW15114.1 hypothetical protein [Candidatus Thorarchaeota archaeon]NIX63187.1 hypothetical protein [Nitrosopumilaceae archaeon]
IKGGAPEPIEPIQFTQSEKQKNAGEIVVIADVGKMDDLWKKSSLYIKEGAPLQSNNIEMPSVDITDQGTV